MIPCILLRIFCQINETDEPESMQHNLHHHPAYILPHVTATLGRIATVADRCHSISRFQLPNRASNFHFVLPTSALPISTLYFQLPTSKCEHLQPFTVLSSILDAYDLWPLEDRLTQAWLHAIRISHSIMSSAYYFRAWSQDTFYCYTGYHSKPLYR